MLFQLPARSTFDLDLHMYVCAREKRLGLVVEESVRAAQSTAQRYKALQRRRERGFRAEFTYVRPRTYTFVRPHMRGHEQHLQIRLYAA